MLTFLRKMILPFIITVLFFFTAMIVLQWGADITNTQYSNTGNIAAIINGEEISWTEYNRIYNSIYQIETQNLDADLPKSKIVELQNTAWQQLLHDRLIRQELTKINMIVTDEEMYSYLRLTPPAELQALPDFQTGGKFDYQKYVNTMANPQAAPFWASVENAVYNDIQKLKLQELVVQTAHVTEAEIKQFFLESTEKVKVGMINVAYKRFSQPPPRSTEEELKEYYENNKELYHIEERAALNIVQVLKKAEPYDWELSYNLAKAIYDSILNEGSDFAEMANTYSQDNSAKDGGDLGWFNEGQMVTEFNIKVFKGMKKGDVSEPVRTQFGWHIIKLFDKKSELEIPRGKTEKEKIEKALASHILIKAEPSQQTLDKAYSRVDDYLTVALNEGFLNASVELKMTIRTSGLFFRNRNIQYIGKMPIVSDFAFDSEIDAISDIYENNSSYFIVQVASHETAGIADFEVVKEKVGVNIVEFKVKTLCSDTAKAIFAAIQNGASMKEAASKFGEEYTEPAPFTRDQFVAEIRRDQNAIGSAFSLKETGDLTKPIEYDQGTVIFKLIEKISPDLVDFTSKRDSVKNAIMLSKQEELYGRWIQSLILSAEIENYIPDALKDDQDFL